MDRKGKLILKILGAFYLNLFIYVFLHELGHMLVMLCAGDTITEFNIFEASVSGVGGSYTIFSSLCLHAAGLVFPLIISFIYMNLYKPEIESEFYRISSWIFCLIPISTLLAWVIIPVMYMNGSAPIGEDATKFLMIFGDSFNPLIVSFVALLLIGLGGWLIIKKKILYNFYEVCKAFKETGKQRA